MRRMSLRNRLRFSIISLVTVMVAIQFLATLRVTADADFHDALDRTESIAKQVQSLLADRLNQEIKRADPPPANLDETIALWTHMLESDPSISGLLEKLMASSTVAVEIQICDQVGKILASSSPASSRLTYRSLPDFANWNIRTLWDRLFEVVSQTREYSTVIPLGVEDLDHPIFTVRIIVSSLTLRDALMPQIHNLAATSALSLLAAILLAVLFSNMVLRALTRLSKRIDYLTAGDFASAQANEGRESEEIEAMSSKLNLLGEQFRDAIQLRGNIDHLLRNIETAVLMFDPEGRLVLAGESAGRLLSRPREHLIGRSLGEIFPRESPLGVAIHTAVERRVPFRDRPAVVESAHGAPGRLLVTVELLENLPGLHQLGTLITLRDVESQRQLRSQIDVSARLTAINRLTGGVAHEIKNPLNAIALHLEVLKAKLAGTNSVGTELSVIEREIARLDRVVKTFLDFTRPVELKLAPADLVALVGEVTALVGPEARRANVSVAFETDAGRAIVQADHDLLKQAVLNVVMNGIESMKDGGQLSITLSRIDDDYQMLIADQGPGIPEELRDKIFNLYFTTKNGGSGIGLAMTFRVVHLHNATIDFLSRPAGGTVFRFRIPAAEDPATLTNQEPAHEIPVSAPPF